MDLPLFVGKQIGRIKSVIGTRSLRRKSAISLSKFVKLKVCENARRTKRVSGRTESLQRSCSPNVTLIMNHMNLKIIRKEKVNFRLKCGSVFFLFENRSSVSSMAKTRPFISMCQP